MSLPYYSAHPPIVATIFDAAGRAYMVLNTPQAEVASAMQAGDLGWLRGEAMWVGDGAPNILTAGAYDVDAATREITLL